MVAMRGIADCPLSFPLLPARLCRKSKEKRQQYIDELYDKTVMQLGYSDYFDTLDSNLVQLSNGKYTLLNVEDYTKARAAGKIKIGGIDRMTEFPESYVEAAPPVEAATTPSATEAP